MALSDWLPSKEKLLAKLPSKQTLSTWQKGLNVGAAAMTSVGGLANFFGVRSLIVAAPQLGASLRVLGLAMQQAGDTRQEMDKEVAEGRLHGLRAAIDSHNVALSSAEIPLRRPEISTDLKAPTEHYEPSATAVKRAVTFEFGSETLHAVPDERAIGQYHVLDATAFKDLNTTLEMREQSAREAQLQYRMTKLETTSPGITKDDLKRVDETITKWNGDHPNAPPLPEPTKVTTVANPSKEVFGRILELGASGEASEHSHLAFTLETASKGVYGVLGNAQHGEFIQAWEQRNAERTSSRDNRLNAVVKAEADFQLVRDAIEKHNAGLTPETAQNRFPELHEKQQIITGDVGYRYGKLLPLDDSRVAQALGHGNYRILSAQEARDPRNMFASHLATMQTRKSQGR